MPDYQHGGAGTDFHPPALIPKTYSAEVLRTIRANSLHDHRLKILPFGAIKIIKELKLNNKKKKRRNRGRTKQPFKQYGCNYNNIISIKRTDHKPESNIIFGTCNVQSLKPKELQVSDLINDYSLDFLVLTETWLNDKHKQWKDCTVLDKDGLSLSTADRVGRKGGGLALIHKTAYNTKLLDRGTRPTFEHATWELKAKKETLAIHGIYHPPPSLANKTTNSLFTEDFTDFVSITLPSHPNNIYIGDFNLHISEEETDPIIFSDSIEAMGLYQHVNFPTHKSGNILDLVLSDIQQSTSVITTSPGPYVSDHRAVISTLNTKRLNPSFTYKEVRRIKEITQDQLIAEFKLENVPLTTKLHEIVPKLKTELSRTLDTLAPLTRRKISLRPKNPWFDSELKTHKRLMRKSEKKWLRNKTDRYWTSYKSIRNSYYNRLKTKKKATLKTKFAECKKEPKKIHTLMKNLTAKQQPIKWPEHTSDENLVEDFANFFLEKITKIREALKDKPTYSPAPTDTPKLQEFKALEEKDVHRVIMSLRTKTCELDPVPTAIFKMLLPKILPLITKIVNLSLCQGKFIQDWKTAIVRPLLKKEGLQLIMSNFRPVSNLSFISKIIEKCMLLQLSQHCENNNLQPDYQSAYREHYSCETAVLKLSNDILWAMEKQHVTCLVALDLSAAFDTVDHQTLLEVLRHKFGLEKTALEWFDQYLRPRSFKVTINGKESSERNLTVSVPQGSCAGANIFNLYCSPLHEVIPPDLQLSGFADDHSVRKSFKASDREEEAHTVEQTEACMLSIKNWMDEMRLKMNPSKTEFIYFGFNKQLAKCNTQELKVSGDLIPRTNLIRYLGVWLDAGLNYKHHIKKKCQASMANFIRIRSIRHLIDSDTTAGLCLSLCISHLDYCNSLLYGIPQSSLKKMQRVQNMCARLVLRKNKKDSATACLRDLHWLPVKYRIQHKILTLTHKCYHNIGPAYLQQLIVKHQARREGLRSGSEQQDLLVIPRTHSRIFADRSFAVAAPVLWNALPNNIRTCGDLLTFKKKLKTHLFLQAFN